MEQLQSRRGVPFVIFIFHFSMFIKMKIEHQFSIFIFKFLRKRKIEHTFSFFIFQLSEKMNDPNIHHGFLSSLLFLALCYSSESEMALRFSAILT